jgi:hypothetical protein
VGSSRGQGTEKSVGSGRNKRFFDDLHMGGDADSKKLGEIRWPKRNLNERSPM